MSACQFGQLEDFFSKLHKGESEPVSKKPNKFKEIYDRWMEGSFAKFEKPDSSILASGKFLKLAKKKSLKMPIQCDSEVVTSESPMKSKKKSKKGKKSLNSEECNAGIKVEKEDSLFSSPGLGSALSKKKASKMDKLFDLGTFKSNDDVSNSGTKSKKRKLTDDNLNAQVAIEKGSPKKKQKFQLGEQHENDSPSKGEQEFDESLFPNLSAKKRKKALKLMKLLYGSEGLSNEVDASQGQEEHVESDVNAESNKTITKDDDAVSGQHLTGGNSSSKKKRNKKKNSAIIGLNQSVESNDKDTDLSLADMDDEGVNNTGNESGASGESKRKRKRQKKRKNMGNENVLQQLDQSEVKEEDEDEEEEVEDESPKKKKMKGNNFVETKDSSAVEKKLSKKEKKLEKKRQKKLGGIVSGLESEPELTKFKPKSEEDDENEDNDQESEKEDDSEGSSDEEGKNKSSFPRTPNMQKLIPKFDSEEKNKRTVFVGNLPMDINEKTLGDIFKPYGKVESVRLRGAIPKKESMSKKVAGITREYSDDATSMKGFVVFKKEEDVEKALALNSTVFNGHHLRVDKARNKEQVNQKPEYNNTATLYLGNLPYQIDDETIWNAFGEYGTVTSVRIVRDRDSGVGKGFGFVEFADASHREAALAADDTEVGGRKIRVRAADNKPPNNRSPRFQNQQDRGPRRNFPFNKFRRNDQQGGFGPRKTFKKFNDNRK